MPPYCQNPVVKASEYMAEIGDADLTVNQTLSFHFCSLKNKTKVTTKNKHETNTVHIVILASLQEHNYSLWLVEEELNDVVTALGMVEEHK